MTIVARGGRFQVSVGSGSDRFRGSAKTMIEAEQLELEEMLRRKTPGEAPRRSTKATTGASIGTGVGKSLKDAFERTMRLHWKGTPAEKTMTINSTSVLKVLGEDTLLVDITASDLVDLVLELEDQGNSGSTINKKTSCLNMMFKTAESEWGLKEYPKAPRRKENKHRIRWMDVDEEEAVLKLVDHLGLADLRDYIIVAIDTGFRRGELLGFKSKDYSQGMLHLHAGETKGDAARSVPATKRVSEVFNRRLNRSVIFQDLNPHTLRWQWEQVRGLMGLDDDPQFVVHMLRHTCASRMVQRGVPLAVVQKWMGHKKIETTLRYAHLAPESLLQAKAALERVDAPQPTADF